MEFKESAYQQLIEGIFTRFPSVQKADFNAAYKPGLDGMRHFAAELGHPENAFRSIHIAGTNGKGSVSNMLTSALGAAGLKVGLYTSPHLVDFRERIRILSGDRAELIPKEYVFRFLSQWSSHLDEWKLSFFEITTGLAFRYFADSGVDVAVVETGLGGRLDSTNILLPDLSVITTIGLDHCHLLGNSLAEIAGEKAGIFKEGVPALIGESQPETDPVFEDKAWMRCPLIYAERRKITLGYRSGEILRKMDLRGEYQKKNLRTVLSAIDILKGMPPYQGLSDGERVVDGLIHTAARMDFHGRWEKLSDLPFVIADIGHNAQALRYNFAQMEKMVADATVSSLIIVYGIMADKDLDAILPLMPRDASYIFVAPEGQRALPAERLLDRYRHFRTAEGNPTVRAYSAESVRSGIQMAIMLAQNLSEQLSRSASAAKPVPPLIYVGGSTFVVAEAVKIFR